MKQRIILITGATSGIGEATARLLAQKGFALILTGRRQDRLEKLHSELEEQVPVHTLCFDVRNRAEVYKAIESLPGEWREVDGLVNNAGLAVGLSPVHKGNEEDWDRMIDTNVKGALYVLKAVIPLMMQRNAGHIINISSIAAKEVYPAGNVYCGTKHALDSITQSVRMELLPYDIKVTSVNPGMVETEFSLVRFKGDEEKASGVYRNVEALKAEDVADVILYCLSTPKHMNLHEVVVMPSVQATVRMVRKRDGSI